MQDQVHEAAGGESESAIAFVKNEHRTIEGLFKGYMASDDDDAKAALIRSICNQLSSHAQWEEELLYPNLNPVVQAEIAQALVEHHAIKQRVFELATSPTDDALRDAKVMVLFEQVRRHFEEEENELLPLLADNQRLLHGVAAFAGRRDELFDMFEKNGTPAPSAHATAL